MTMLRRCLLSRLRNAAHALSWVLTALAASAAPTVAHGASATPATSPTPATSAKSTTSATSAIAGASADVAAAYDYALPLTVATTAAVVQLRLPAAVYQHALTPLLDDVRVFDARGVALPYALRMPAVEQRASHRWLALKIFPLMDDRHAGPLDLDVHTDSEGGLLSVRVQAAGERAGAGEHRNHGGHADGSAAAPQLAALILDLGHSGSGAASPARTAANGASQAAGAAAPLNNGPRNGSGDTPLIDGLRFTPPPGQRDYSADVWLDTSDDMKHWEAAGGTELNWLVSQDAETLANDRLDFAPRRFRYARLTWRSGTPQQFATVSAQQLLSDPVAPNTDTMLLSAQPGRQAGDLAYAAPLALTAQTAGLEFKDGNVVLPALLGTYRELPARQLGQTATWRFEPVVKATFYRIGEGAAVRASGDIALAPVHTALWVLRSQGAALPVPPPVLRLSWTPANLVFLASGNAPYTLAVGRSGATSAARDMAQVAPGFTDAELQALGSASAGEARRVNDSAPASASVLQRAGTAAQQRLLILWGVLLLGVTVLVYMVSHLIKQAKPPQAESREPRESRESREQGE